MIDTIHLILKNSSVDPEIDLKAQVKKYICINHIYSNEYRINGMLGNMIVNATYDYVKVEGSLAKFYLGNNLSTLNPNDIRNAIQTLSNKLNLPMEKAVLRRIDIGYNIPVVHNPEMYFHNLGDAAGFNRRIHNYTSLYYSRKSQHMVFYDKVKELKNKKRYNNISMPDTEILRYELRISKGSIQHLQKDFGNITADMLYNHEFYTALIRKWLSSYESITKLPDLPLQFEFENIQSPNDIIDRCVYYTLSHVDVLGMVKTSFRNRRHKNKYDANRHQRIKDKLKGIIRRNQQLITCQTPLCDELTRKIRDITAKQLALLNSNPDIWALADISNDNT